MIGLEFRTRHSEWECLHCGKRLLGHSTTPCLPSFQLHWKCACLLLASPLLASHPSSPSYITWAASQTQLHGLELFKRGRPEGGLPGQILVWSQSGQAGFFLTSVDSAEVQQPWRNILVILSSVCMLIGRPILVPGLSSGGLQWIINSHSVLARQAVCSCTCRQGHFRTWPLLWWRPMGIALGRCACWTASPTTSRRRTAA